LAQISYQALSEKYKGIWTPLYFNLTPYYHPISADSKSHQLFHKANGQGKQARKTFAI
jgi:hypothetical protein